MSDEKKGHADGTREDRETDPEASRGNTGGCPFHSGGNGSQHQSGTERQDDTAQQQLAEKAVDRRAFMRSALAIGGTGALAAAVGSSPVAASGGDLGALDVPQGPRNPNAFPERQHAWKQDIKLDPFGNVVLPNHQLILFLNYVGDETQTGKERREVEAAFRTLERAFQRLAGGDHDADNDGLVFMVGYSRAYFDRVDGNRPWAVDLQTPEQVLKKTDDDPSKADDHDAVVLLSSDTVPVLLASEAALFGELDSLNGIDVRGTLAGVFDKAERRTAFVGKGLPREKLDNDDIDDDAPLSMGYKSGFKDNVATEDAVTISRGPFREGTTFQVSKLRLDLEKWYDRNRGERDKLMFSDEHSEENIGNIGEGLEDDSNVTEDIVDSLEETAREKGRVGHAAKTAQARNDDFEPLILRRSEGVNNEFQRNGKVDFNFSAVMEDIQDFVETRQAMNASHLDDRLDDDGDGILPFMEVTNRATFLLPPRKRRSLPRARPNY